MCPLLFDYAWHVGQLKDRSIGHVYVVHQSLRKMYSWGNAQQRVSSSTEKQHFLYIYIVCEQHYWVLT